MLLYLLIFFRLINIIQINIYNKMLYKNFIQRRWKIIENIGKILIEIGTAIRGIGRVIKLIKILIKSR